MSVTIHEVLAGAYRGKDIDNRTLLSHASVDGGVTSLCKRIKQHNLCDEVVGEVAKGHEPDCYECRRRITRKLKLETLPGQVTSTPDGVDVWEVSLGFRQFVLKNGGLETEHESARDLWSSLGGVVPWDRWSPRAQELIEKYGARRWF